MKSTGKWKSKNIKKGDSINFINVKFLKKFGKRVYLEIDNVAS